MDTDPYDDTIRQMRGYGLLVESIDIGRLKRCKVEGDKGGKESGWYVVYEFTTKSGKRIFGGKRIFAGRFGNWKDPGCPDSGWKIELNGVGYTDEEKLEYKKRVEDARKQAAEEKKKRAKEAATRAAQIWSDLPESGISPYLNRKKVKAYGLKFSRGSIVVPVRTIDDKLVGLQFIDSTGDKKFLTGTAKLGAFHLIGEIKKGDIIGIAEGYSTGATCYQVMQWPTAIVFDAGNILPVVKLLRQKYPENPIVIFGDDDHELKENAGRIKACKAAGNSRGRAIFPNFKISAGKTDWNDLYIEQGGKIVSDQINMQLNSTEIAADEEIWSAGLARNKDGAVKATLYNIISVLENRAEWKGLFALDGFANQIQLKRKSPYGTDPGPLTDIDGGEVAAWLGDPSNYGISVSSMIVLEAIEIIAKRRRFHPVTTYLDGLKWDRVERLRYMMPDYFGTAKNDYTEAIGINWLVSAVARVRQPGSKVDTMVILEGRQGVGKSTAVRTLCGPTWFAEMLDSPQHKDFYQTLTGRWIVEIAELQAFNKADRNRIKQAISAQEDTYRPSYGRYARQFPRQCVFVGTTNDDAYLKDETGARRFFPVRCDDINLKALEIMRDQLWAEADARYKKGSSWWEFPESAIDEQDARYDVDAWEDPIIKWLNGLCKDKYYPEPYQDTTVDKPIYETTISDVMRYALNIDIAKHSRPDQMRVGAIMRRLRWKRKQKCQQGRRRYIYKRPGWEAD